jgi:hypothetical protein
MRNTIYLWRWPIAALLTLALGRFLAARPDITERYYTRGLYPCFRWVFDAVNGLLPFPLFYVVIVVVLFFLAKGVAYWIFEAQPLGNKLLQTGKAVLSAACVVLVLFYWLWGFNYNRQSIENQLGITPAKLTPTQLRALLDDQTQRMVQARSPLQQDTAKPLTLRLEQDGLEQRLRQEVERSLAEMHLFDAGKPRGRQPFWNGFLLRFGAAGIYNPFTGECNIDPGLPEVVKPHTMAHELCHGYGYGDEGTCNFLAYVALSRSEDTYFRYSAELDFWRELAAAYRKTHPEEMKAVWDHLPTGFQGDILHIQRTINQYPEFFEAFRRRAYDQYLKAQGIQEGIQNYGTVIELVVAWRRK